MDYTCALESRDPAVVLQAMTQAFIFERDICTTCAGQRLKRVVSVLADGRIVVAPPDPTSVVQYIIFELADGDIRNRMDVPASFDLAFALRSLHHIAVGLRQLHGLGIAHQDVKPSNVLVFAEQGSKLSDLGCSSVRGGSAPRDELEVAGDHGYAPPELLYGYAHPEWATRRLGCDAYLLGSMIVFFFAKVSMTAVLFNSLGREHHWTRNGITFQQALPHLREAFSRALPGLCADFPASLASELCNLVSELCEPDPTSRGDPRWRGSPLQFALEKYISRFDFLATKAEHQLRGCGRAKFAR